MKQSAGVAGAFVLALPLELEQDLLAHANAGQNQPLTVSEKS
jgi:hypothetical protein